MDPLYTTDNIVPAYQLNWGLTIFWRDTPLCDDLWLADLQNATEPDGVRVLRHRTTTRGASQFFVSTKPHVAPSELIRSVKGRLQYVIRKHAPKAFQRNYCLRSIGSASRTVVEEYVANQLKRHTMADPRVHERLAKFQRSYRNVDLSKSIFSSHGQYWYNLHLVVVNEQRIMEIRDDVLNQLSEMIERVSLKHEYRLSRVGLLADHIHLTLGCPIGISPEKIALSYLNNCSYVCGMIPVFKFSYYVGTIGEYDLGALA